MERYISLDVLERQPVGSCGYLFKCFDWEKLEFVTGKRVDFCGLDGGMPGDVLREISVLKELDHENVTRLLDVEIRPDCCRLYTEYLDFDLDSVIKDYFRIDRDAIKRFLFQILQGVSYCHSQKVMHRDLRPGTVLIDPDKRTLKLADFCFARTFEVPLPKYSREVNTRAYRAPEILLGVTYSSAVDIWSVGCIFAELVTRKVLFSGATSVDMMVQICRMLGLPDERDFPGPAFARRKLLEMEKLPREPVVQLKDHFPSLEAEGVDLLSRMLCINPKRRITALDALQHQYFKDAQGNYLPFLV